MGIDKDVLDIIDVHLSTPRVDDDMVAVLKMQKQYSLGVRLSNGNVLKDDEIREARYRAMSPFYDCNGELI